MRILTQNWESSFIEAWILQILLSEVLGVPSTIEIGTAEGTIDLYDHEDRLTYGISNDFDAFQRSAKYADCRLSKKQQQQSTSSDQNGTDDNASYQSCAHFLPEIWSMRMNEVRAAIDEGTVEAPTGMGMAGLSQVYISQHTARRDPTLMSYFGLTGPENRRKLAETFLRPTTWKVYCDDISPTQCQEPDDFAQRAPTDESDFDRYFVRDVYSGYFRATDENNCDKFPDTCTGHIAGMFLLFPILSLLPGILFCS